MVENIFPRSVTLCKQKVETKVDVVWIIIICIFIIIYYSYVITCSLPSVNA